MQVTGSNNSTISTSRLSIRIPSGQSLHSEELDKVASAKRVELILCGPVVAAYPKELAEEIDFNAMLSTHGIPSSQESEIVHFGSGRSVGYAAVVDGSVAKLIASERAKGKEVVVTSPLEMCVGKAIVATRRSKNIFLHLEDTMCYVALAENMRLRYAEAIPTENAKELVALLALLNKDFDLKKAQFTLSGDEGKKYYKTIRSYFRRVEMLK